ncbi:ABC1 kinase family protein [Rivihabitans pingtungensis]|jgi:ubiquinone biosynthesis protein|uniref:ABC1 kinase family protein n=1 Tax=Rivihabitans pingtungensis TaxID=1054498 RepID=UPI0023F21692|nr:AarF/UbiB family protein [Rivihabitans pingtungensis]
MLKETLVAMRDLPRLREISAILIRHGLGEFAQRLKLPKAMERATEWLRVPLPDPEEFIETPVRVRRAFEELGPTFIKFGQILSTRVDVFPPDWIAEFEKLQTDVPPLPPEVLQPWLFKLCQGDPHEVFAEFDYTPIGSASIAQVHRARLHDGTPVAVKVRRPGIAETIEADLRILSHLAYLVELEFPDTRRYQPGEMINQFAKSLRRELDLAAEARNMERFAQHFANDPVIVVPKVYWQHTHARMNVQDFIEGIPASKLEQADAAGLDRVTLAARGADAVLKMILLDGFFHADPHPGNVFFLPENRIVFIDFGMVGRLSPARRDELVDLLAALSRRNERGILEVLLEWTGSEAVDESQLHADIGEFLFQYDQVQLKDLNLSMLINDVMALMRDHSIMLPSDLSMLFKALITLEGFARQINPHFQMVEHLTPFVRKIILDRYTPSTLLEKGGRTVMELLGMVGGLPRDLSRLSKEIRRGKFRIDIDVKRLDHFGQQLDKSANRLTLGIVTGCLIIGSSIVMTVKAGPMLFGLPLLGFLGFVVAFFNSLWLMASIWRSGKDL